MPDVGSVKYQVELDNSKLDHDISKTESEISSKLDAISGKLGQSLGYQVFKDIGSAAIKAGEAMVGFAADSVKVGAEFDSSMAQVAATMGVTVDEVQELRDFAREMGASTAFSASEAADALNYMALAGYDAEKSMEMLPTVLDLAAAGDIELARASDMVTDAASALGLTTEETAQMVDKMAQASSKSNTSVAQLGDAILTVGGTAKNLAGGTTELSTALGIMADAGIKGAEGGTHLRNILLALNPTTKDADAAFKMLGVDAYDADGNLRPLEDTFAVLATKLDAFAAQDRATILSDIFNKTDLAAVDSMLTAAIVDIDEVRETLNATGVEWDKYSDRVWAADGVIEGLFSDIAWNLGELKTGQMSVAEMAEYLASEYELSMDDALTAVQAVTDGVSQQQDRWHELAGYIDDSAGAAQRMADTQLDNLAGDVKIMQSALADVQITISDALTPTLREFVQFGAGALQELSTAFKEGGLSGAVDAFGQILTEGIALILSKAPDLVSAGFQLILSLTTGLIDNLPAMLDAGLEMILALVDGLIDNIPKIIESARKIVVSLAEFILNNADRIVEKGIELIAALTKGMILAIPDMVRAIPTIIAAMVKALMSFNWMSIGVDIIRGIGRGIAEAAGTLIDAAVEAARNAMDSVKNFLGIHSPSTRAAKEIGEPYAEGVAEGIDDGMNDISKSVELMGRTLTADVVLPDVSGWAGSLGAAFSASNSQQITVVSELDGREIARGTAVFMNEQLAWEAR